MTASETLEKLGRLIRDGRLDKKLARQPFAKVVGIDPKTLASMENGTRIPWETNQRKLEEALGWRPGSIQEVIEKADIIPITSLTLEYMREAATESTWQDLDAEETDRTRPVTRAGELSNEELIGELAYRLRNKNIHTGNLPTLG